MYTYCTSNEFKVTDIECFRLWAAVKNLEVKVSPDDDDVVVVIPLDEHWHDLPGDKNTESLFLSELSVYLAEAQVAVLYTAEFDVTTLGYAIMVNSKGLTGRVSLLEAAEKLRAELQK